MILVVIIIIAVVKFVRVRAVALRRKYCIYVSLTSPTTNLRSFNFTHETVPKLLMISLFDNLHTDGNLSSVQQKFSEIFSEIISSYNSSHSTNITTQLNTISLL